MKWAPVVLFVYNRALHTRKTLEALSENELAADSELYIYSDGPQPDATGEQLNNIKEVRRVIHEKKWCRSVTIIESEKNKGLANSIINGVTEIVNQYGKVIVLEDDLVTSKWFLTYMNDALNKYENEDAITCISGYIYPVKNKLPETFFIKGADCWGWAVWKRAWKIFEPDGKKLLDELENKRLTSSFDFDNSYGYTRMLRDQIQGKNNSWAIRWYASAFLKNKYCLYPGRSLVRNIGADGSGTHGTTNRWNVNLYSGKIEVKSIRVEESAFAKERIKDFFRRSAASEKSIIEKIVNKLKSVLK
jgi:glycosyl transferase family 2